MVKGGLWVSLILSTILAIWMEFCFEGGLLLWPVFMLVFTIIVICISIKKNAEYAKPENAVGFSFSMKKDKYNTFTDGCIYLTKRTSNNRRDLKVKATENHLLTYHPAQTVYTGATVGGITTGGFHTTEAYHTCSTSKGGKYKLVYTKNYLEAGMYEFFPPYDIKFIILSPTLLEEAKEHDVIKRFLEKDKLVLTHMSEELSHKISVASESGNQTLLMNTLLGNASDIHLSKEDATAILNWICGE